jgi:AAA family ATP:ADP antiporter
MIVLIFVKATKYTIFDNTKEMLLVTLPSEMKSQSKVADSLAGRWGKTLGGVSLIVVQFLFGALSSLPVMITIFGFMVLCSIAWIAIVYKLSVIEQKAQQQEKTL